LHRGGVVLSGNCRQVYASPPRLWRLTMLELTVVGLLCQLRSDVEIGVALGLGLRGAQQMVQQVLRKLGVQSRAEARARAAELGLHWS
jgi:DNA-binding CsgD family transcriptional regulator